MSTYLFIEVSTIIPKWFKEHKNEQSTSNIIDTWTDKGLFRNYNGNYSWFQIIESEGLLMFELIEPQIPSIVITIEKYTRTYCDTNKFFTYYYDTHEDGTVVYAVSSGTQGRLSKYKNKTITNIIEVDKPDIAIQID
jgi:hypothetical protein